MLSTELLRDEGFAKEVERRLCEARLSEFVRAAWGQLEPGAQYVHGRVIEAVCEHLEAVASGELTRLLINIPPGSSKEIWVEEPVLTARGRIRLGDVLVGDEVVTHRGRLRRVSAVHDKGQQETLDIATANGRWVKAELMHPFLTTRGWVSARDLRVGDILAAVTPQCDFPGLLSEEEARFLGYMVGDGSCTHSPSFTNSDEEVLQDFEHCAKTLGIIATRRQPTPSAKRANGKFSIVGLKGARELLERHGLLGKSSYTKFVPSLVLASSQNVIANFLGAYWSCDGMITIRHKRARGAKYLAAASSVSERLARDVQHCLLRLGIDSRVRERNLAMFSKRQGANYRYWVVMSTSHEEVVKFVVLKGLCSRKAEQLRVLMPQRFIQGPLHEDEITEIREGGLAECRCLTVEGDHSFTASDLAVHNSLTASVFFPAWLWGPRAQPEMRFLTASHSEKFATRDARKMRDLVKSEWFRGRWPIELVREGETSFANSATGFREAMPLRSLTGARGDILIIDDPHSTETAESEAERLRIARIFRESIPTRLNDPSRSAIIVIMQRLHERDVSGIALEMGYEHLMLPMEFDPGRKCVTSIGWEDWREDEGELLWPERFPASVVERDKRALGPIAVACQFQQSPIPRGGNIFKRDDWRLWEGAKFPTMDLIVASLDTAFTAKKANDPSAMTIWGLWREHGREGEAPKLMLMWAWRKWLEFQGSELPRGNGESEKEWLARVSPEWGLLEWVIWSCRKFRVSALLIENSAAGLPLAQELQRRVMRTESWGVRLIKPQGDKRSRAEAIQPLFANGLIFAPDKEWAEMVIVEMMNFRGLPSDRDDLCFVAGTKIATTQGDISIERVRVGDEVITPLGIKKVLASGTTGAKPIVENKSVGLRGTPQHPVFTFTNGYVNLCEASNADTARLTLCGLIRLALLKPSSLTELNISGWGESDGIISVGGALGRRRWARRVFTSLYGNTLLDAGSPRAMRFTIKTATRLIAALRIWSVYRLGRIEGCLRGWIRKLGGHCLRGFAPWRVSGIDRLKDVLGIRNTLDTLCISRGGRSPFKQFSERESASGAAEVSSTGIRGTYCVRPGANGKKREELEKHEKVYNLSVEGAKCYFANGVLVHNCDSTSQVLKWLRDQQLLSFRDEEIADEFERSRVGEKSGAIYPV